MIFVRGVYIDMLIIYLLFAFLFLSLATGLYFFFQLKKKKQELFQLEERNFELEQSVSELEEKVENSIQQNLREKERFFEAERELQQQILSQQNYSDIFENSENFIFTLDSVGKFLYVNPFCVKRLGYNAAEFCHLNFSDFLPKHNSKWFAILLGDLNSKNLFYDTELIDRFGENHFVGLQFSQQMDIDGILSGFICIGFDLINMKSKDDTRTDAINVERSSNLDQPVSSEDVEPNFEIEVSLNFDKVLEITEGDIVFMSGLFQSYFNSLEECKIAFATHIQNDDLAGLEFLLHKIRATTKTFQIRSLELKFAETIMMVKQKIQFSETQKEKIISDMNFICSEVTRKIKKFAKLHGVMISS